MTQIRFDRIDSGEPLDVAVNRVLIAGFTGRDAASVQEHIDELRALGVPVPDTVPTVVEVAREMLTTAETIEVDGTFTSGEVEPVLVLFSGRRWLTVGSDHTDRDVERESIARSKQVCPKVVARTLLPLGDDNLDAVQLESWVDGEGRPYQQGGMEAILPLGRIEEALQAAGVTLMDGDVVFLGTLPVTGGSMRPSRSFRATLREPRAGHRIDLAYHVNVRPTSGAAYAQA
ncbi:MAG: DUF2848 domain-containing protein [Nitriliruptorales bacterium]|nr:DUF2848 domain-containing protein [Nitriliruptorales bacterium]